MVDQDGWHFTKKWKIHSEVGLSSGKGILRQRKKKVTTYGPNVTPLMAFSWKIRCPPKIKHFLWYIVSGCISVNKNLRS